MTKYNNIFLYFAILSLSLWGCSESHLDTNTDTNNDIVRLNPYINTNSVLRASNTSFDLNDVIGVFAVPYIDGNTNEGDIEADKYLTNVKNTYNGSEWNAETSMPWYNGDTKITLYAYYPYSISASSTNTRSYTFNIKQDQSNETNFKNSDFLWSKSAPTAPTKNRISLPFTHRMSKIRINIKTENGFVNNDIINSIKTIQNVYIDADINLSNGQASILNGAKPKEVIPYQLASPITGYAVTTEAIVLPQTIISSTDFISLKSTNNGTPFIYQIQEDLVLSEGKLYTFNITVDRTGISITTDAIKDWDSYPDIDGNINQPAYKAFDISGLDWNKTRIYKVLDNGIQVAEVTKEYLYKNNVIDAQAIVIYKMLDNGQTDISSGLVAQVMSSTKNSNNEYDTATNTIHGGNVIWDVANNVISNYTEGTNNPIEKIEINKGNITEAQPHAIYTLTLEPDLVKDIDNNEYGIVKIGNQVWMRENLKTEHYRDGSNVDVYYYNDDLNNKNIYGGLYSWITTMNDKGLSPKGWHIPSNDEFVSLNTYVSGTKNAPYYTAGAKLKASTMWTYYYNNTNLTGFSGLPGGRRLSDGRYNELISYGQWWTSDEINSTTSRRMYLDYGNTGVWMTNLAKDYSESIRCLKD